ncbi:MAG: hypothetical protein KGL11_02630 [Alphaproteobacteria bacterium]|nr:hypothetical protein [Alphaproteobacteria bacterium]
MPHKKSSSLKSHAKANGEIRRKHGDARVGTLRGIYGEDFASGYRSGAKLSTVLERAGATSFSDFIRREIFKQTESAYRPALKRLANK